MKTAAALLILAALSAAQTVDPFASELQTLTNIHNQQIAVLQNQVNNLTAESALLTRLQTQCPTCIDAMNAALNSTQAPLSAIIICCAPATLPASTPGTEIVYIVPTSETISPPPAAAAAQPTAKP